MGERVVLHAALSAEAAGALDGAPGARHGPPVVARRRGRAGPRRRTPDGADGRRGARTGHRAARRSSVRPTTTSRATDHWARVTKRTHSDDRCGDSSGHFDHARVLEPHDARGLLEDLLPRQRDRSGQVEPRARRQRQVERPHERDHDVVDRDRLRARLQPARQDHDRQARGQIAHDEPAQAAVPDDHARAQLDGLAPGRPAAPRPRRAGCAGAPSPRPPVGATPPRYTIRPTPAAAAAAAKVDAAARSRSW